MHNQELSHFFSENRDLIERVLPGFIIDMSKVDDTFRGLETRIWNMTQDEPMMQKLGKENFYALPVDKKLPIILSALQMSDLLLKLKRLS